MSKVIIIKNNGLLDWSEQDLRTDKSMFHLLVSWQRHRVLYAEKVFLQTWCPVVKSQRRGRLAHFLCWLNITAGDYRAINAKQIVLRLVQFCNECDDLLRHLLFKDISFFLQLVLYETDLNATLLQTFFKQLKLADACYAPSKAVVPLRSQFNLASPNCSSLHFKAFTVLVLLALRRTNVLRGFTTRNFHDVLWADIPKTKSQWLSSNSRTHKATVPHTCPANPALTKLDDNMLQLRSLLFSKFGFCPACWLLANMYRLARLENEICKMKNLTGHSFRRLACWLAAFPNFRGWYTGTPPALEEEIKILMSWTRQKTMADYTIGLLPHSAPGSSWEKEFDNEILLMRFNLLIIRKFITGPRNA